MADGYTGFGIVIPPLPGGAAGTEADIEAWAAVVGRLPSGDRMAAFNALRAHWNGIHFGVGGDNQVLDMNARGNVLVRTLDFDYSGVSEHEGLELPPT